MMFLRICACDDASRYGDECANEGYDDVLDVSDVDGDVHVHVHIFLWPFGILYIMISWH